MWKFNYDKMKQRIFGVGNANANGNGNADGNRDLRNLWKLLFLTEDYIKSIQPVGFIAVYYYKRDDYKAKINRSIKLEKEIVKTLEEIKKTENCKLNVCSDHFYDFYISKIYHLHQFPENFCETVKKDIMSSEPYK